MGVELLYPTARASGSRDFFCRRQLLVCFVILYFSVHLAGAVQLTAFLQLTALEGGVRFEARTGYSTRTDRLIPLVGGLEISHRRADLEGVGVYSISIYCLWQRDMILLTGLFVVPWCIYLCICVGE